MAETNYYLVEYAKSNRATCSACKNKIEKGELRLGSPIQLGEHLSHKFRHWTCTTPAVLANMRGKIERHSLGEAVHGLEGLKREDQARVQRWLDNGPSDHEEEQEKDEGAWQWREGLCLEEREEAEEAPVKTPKNRAPRKKRAPSKRAAAKAAEAGEDAADEDYRPAKKAATKKRGAAKRGMEA